MSFTTWWAEKSRAYAENKAVTKGDAIKQVVHENGTINVRYVDPEEMDRNYSGDNYLNAALYFGDNANESYIDDNDEEGDIIHSQEFTAILESDAAEKFFSDGLKQRVMWAVYAGVGAMMAGLLAAGMVVQYAG